MFSKRELLCVILCNLVRMGWTSEPSTDTETILHALADFRKDMADFRKDMADFRKDILASIQFSLEYQSGQHDEIKSYVENKIKGHEERMKNESESNKIIQEVTNRLLVEGSAQMHKIDETLAVMSSEVLPKSCNFVKSKSTGAFNINPFGKNEKPLLVLCNFENNFKLGGGWTVFQRRMDGSVDFYRNWTMYKHGFGDVNGEHWLGLETLHLMTKSGRHELLVLLEDFEGNTTYALYDEFKVGSEEEKYKLTVGKYSGRADDSLTSHNGMKFSTMDQDNDLFDGQTGCAITYKGAWWFESCYWSHLNGRYYQKGNHLDKKGVRWIDFPRANYSLKSTTMMFRSRT